MRVFLSAALAAVIFAGLAASPAGAARRLWVDPVAGSDRARGTQRKLPLRTLTAAWNRAHGRTRITILRGRLRPGAVPSYFEDKAGVRIEGRRRVRLPALNLFNVRDLTLAGVTVRGDVHCERCDGLTLRQVTIRGRRGGELVQEGLKVNQSSRLLVEDSDISGAWDNAIDLVAVNHATLRRNRIHDAGDWCAYAKGGSANVNVTANRIYDCGTGGFTAGQGTGLQFMRAPWLRYEAYGVRVWNNLIYDTEGAGLGVNGGFNVLFARNTLLRVGSRSHALEVVFGLRSCDGQPGDEGRERCGQYLGQGAWGTELVDDGTNAVRVPNLHVFFYDNLVLKAPGSEDISIAGPFDQRGHGAPSPALADDDLRLVGNVITTHAPGAGPAHPLPDFVWNGPGAGTPPPASLANDALPGMPATAGSKLR
jgi:Right handed beta helix region